MRPGKRRFASAALLGLLAGPVYAQDMGARSLARGDASRADGDDVGAEERSLAALSLTPAYVLYGGAELGPDGRLLFRGGALDSRTSLVTLGAGYRWLSDEAPPTGAELPGWKEAGSELVNPETWQRVHVGAALPFLEHRMSVAAHARFDWRTSALGGEQNAFNFGFSAVGRPVEGLTVALGARNLLDSPFSRIGRQGDLAVRYDAARVFGIEADVIAPLDDTLAVDTLGWAAGLDVGAVDWLAVRGGWSLRSGRHSASAGIGLRSEKACLDYGVRLALDGSLHNWHALDVRINF